MSRLPSELYPLCRNILLKCGEFDSDTSLRAVFITEELYPFRDGLPQAMNREERVDLCLDFLVPRRLDDGRAVLPLFLTILRDKQRQGNILRDQLATLVEVVQSPAEKIAISEDGQFVIPDDDTPYPPSPGFDPNFLKELTVPGGAVRLRDKFYIEREADARLRAQMARRGSTTTIRAPRQTGKTSLLMRGIHHAYERGATIVFLDFQSLGGGQLSSLDVFLQELAQLICDELGLDECIVEQAWRGKRSTPQKLSRLIEKQILPALDEPIVLAMDEADSLLQTDFYKDFFGLLRSWHNLRAHPSRGQLWEKLNIVLVISTEPYLLVDDIHQSPFNVGLDLGLSDFNETQVSDLNRRHGSPVTDGDLPHLMNLLHGHPFLTRRALYAMVIEGVKWAELTRSAATDHGPFGDHLRHQYRILGDKPKLKKALEEIVRTNRCSDEMALFRLLRAGLVKGGGNVYTCRCSLYEQYFRGKLL
jgi:hypothetical protein